MEDGDNILGAIYEEDNLDDDVDMVDVEEGELVDPDSQNVLGQSSAGDINEANQEPQNKNRKRNKKNNKKKRKGSGSNAMDVNRFVLDTCRRLKEKKSYMVYTAVGCLGVSALSDLVNEVDAIQACGGQKTADGRRFRTGGGILWTILKVREPNVYKEIMKKAREFEKQFRQPNVMQRPVPKKEDSQGVPFSFSGRDQSNASDSDILASRTQNQPFSFSGRDQSNASDSDILASQTQNQHEPAISSDSDILASQTQNQHEPAISEEKPISIHDRLRVPVSYDDDLLGDNPVNDAN